MIKESCYFINKLKDHDATIIYCDNAYRHNGNLPLKYCDLCNDYINKDEVDIIVYEYLEKRKIHEF